jgi:hypothetical protein
VKDFNSQQDILNAVVKAENTLENKYEAMYNRGELTLADTARISREINAKEPEQITKNYIAQGIIKTEQTGNHKVYELTTSAPFYADVLNKDGVVVINDTVYQYTDKYQKLITDGNLNNISLLKSAVKGNDSKHIMVGKLNRTAASNQKDFQLMFDYNYQIQSGDKKIVVTDFLNEYCYYDQYGNLDGRKAYIYDLKFYNEKKNWRGQWIEDDNAEVTISSTLIVKSNGVIVYQYWGDNLPIYHNYGCYSASVIIYQDIANTAVRQFSPQKVHWTRSGGNCGFSDYTSPRGWNWN